MHRRFILVTTILVLAVNMAHTVAAFTVKGKAAATSAVVTIVDKVAGTTSSGFVAGVDRSGWLILGSAHGIDGDGRIDVFVCPNAARPTRYSAERLAVDATRDLALLRVFTRDPPPAVIPVVPRGFPSPDRVLCFGRRDDKVVRTKMTVLGTERMTVDRYGVDGHFFRISHPQEPGSSGAPVVAKDDDGRRFALGVWWGRSGNEGRAVSTAALHAFLDEAGYGYLYRQTLSTVKPPNEPLSDLLTDLGQLDKVLKHRRKSWKKTATVRSLTRVNGRYVEIRSSQNSSFRLVIEY